MQAVGQDCSQPCSCPAETPLCPVGTSLVLDGCSCCKVCARQAGEPCSLLEPCDHHKDLYCDYSLLSDTETGICMGELIILLLPFEILRVIIINNACFVHIVGKPPKLTPYCMLIMCNDWCMCCSSRRSDVWPWWCDLPQRRDVSTQLQVSVCVHEWRDWLRTNMCQQHTTALSRLPLPATCPDPWQVLRGMAVWPDPTRRLLPVSNGW